MAKTTVLTDDWVRLDVDMGHTRLRSEGAAGTQWMYVRVPLISGEWHPFSLAAHGPSVVIKGAGDWSKALHALAVSTATQQQQQQQQQQQPHWHRRGRQASQGLMEVVDASVGMVTDQAVANPHLVTAADTDKSGSQLVCQLPVEIDGVYGHQAPPWQSYSHILLIGGGVGITPWLPLMDSGGGAPSGLSCAQRRCSLIFTCRNEVRLSLLPYVSSLLLIIASAHNQSL